MSVVIIKGLSEGEFVTLIKGFVEKSKDGNWPGHAFICDDAGNFKIEYFDDILNKTYRGAEALSRVIQDRLRIEGQLEEEQKKGGWTRIGNQ